MIIHLFKKIISGSGRFAASIYSEKKFLYPYWIRVKIWNILRAQFSLEGNKFCLQSQKTSEEMEKNTKLKHKSRLLMGLVKSPADLTTGKFVYYFGPTFNDNITFPLSEARQILKHHKFNCKRNTLLYLHGYLENLQEESVSVIVNSYLCRYDHNIIVLDWEDLAEGSYMLDAVVNIKQLGPVLAKTLLELFENGLDIDKLHIVGHSLGGQLAGIIGREIISRTNGVKQVPRITALDPAFPSFYIVKLAKHLNKKDAKFVDVIHTDAWLYGTPFSTGTADFWPNGGKTLQPGCPRRNFKLLSENDLCSHRRSWWYWAESVAGKYEYKFNAVKAKSWNDFKSGNIEEIPGVVMGLDCRSNISGNFYLQTNGTPPYAKGMTGTKYS